MTDMQQRMIHTDLMYQGALIWMFALAYKMGPKIHISAEDIKKSKTVGYKFSTSSDGSIDIVEDGYSEKFNMD